jgi:hypothetical protein
MSVRTSNSLSQNAEACARLQGARFHEGGGIEGIGEEVVCVFLSSPECCATIWIVRQAG